MKNEQKITISYGELPFPTWIILPTLYDYTYDYQILSLLNKTQFTFCRNQSISNCCSRVRSLPWSASLQRLHSPHVPLPSQLHSRFHAPLWRHLRHPEHLRLQAATDYERTTDADSSPDTFPQCPGNLLWCRIRCSDHAESRRWSGYVCISQ